MNTNEIPTPRGAYRPEAINMNEMPTPENDDLRTLWRNAYGNDMFSAVEKILNSHEDLERRLTIAREALDRISIWSTENSVLDIARKTLTNIALKS